jgi:hypothetical protein
MNMDEDGADGYTAEDLLLMAAAQPPAKKKRRLINHDAVCKHCGKKGHTTTRSKACLKNKSNPLFGVDNPEEAVSAGIDVAAAFADMDEMDNMPFVPDDDESTVMSISEFHDAGTWDDEDQSDHEAHAI